VLGRHRPGFVASEFRERNTPALIALIGIGIPTSGLLVQLLGSDRSLSDLVAADQAALPVVNSVNEHDPQNGATIW
jgi:hypothetical protein